MSFNNPLPTKVVGKAEKSVVKVEPKSDIKNQIFNRLAEELCSDTPNKSKIKRLCSEGQILFSGDMVDLMSTVLFELSEIKQYKLR